MFGNGQEMTLDTWVPVHNFGLVSSFCEHNLVSEKHFVLLGLASLSLTLVDIVGSEHLLFRLEGIHMFSYVNFEYNFCCFYCGQRKASYEFEYEIKQIGKSI